ncbi:MAG: tetratricopeptide repeat protein [Bacteroidetes bacterium]|jgi:signal transduction histidine kinase/Flp pilus assembly protein TadD|nr:tetratricopeptide repeat protein [Bacteroidota bacterium]
MNKCIFIFLLLLILTQAFILKAANSDSLLRALEKDHNNPELLRQLGEYYYQHNDYENAANRIEQALQYKKSNSPDFAELHLLLGKIYLSASAPDPALRSLQKVVNANIHDSLNFAARRAMGDVFKSQKKFNQSRQQYNMAYALAADNETKAGILNLIGSIYWQRGMYSNAIAIYDSALHVIDHKPGDLMVRLVNNKATCYKLSSEFNTALKLHNKALQVAINIGDTVQIANTLNFIGSTYFRNNQNDSALQFYQKVYNMRHEGRDSVGLYAISQNLARLHEKLLNHDSAIMYNQKALQFIAKKNKSQRAVTIHNNLGNIYFEMGEYTKSASHYFQSMQLAHSTGDDQLLAQTYNRLSQLYSRIGNFERALEYQQFSIDHTQKSQNMAQLAYRVNQLGNLYFNNGFHEQALEQYQKAAEIHQSLHDQKSIAQSNNNMGNAYREMGQYNEAEKLYKQALAINNRLNDNIQSAYTLNNLGNIEQLRNNSQHALNFFQKAYELSKKNNIHFIHSLVARKIGEYYLTEANRPGVAEKFFNESLSIGQQINHPELIKNALYQLYILEMKRENYKNALDYYRQFNDLEKNMIVEANNQKIIEQQLNFELEQTRDTIQFMESALIDSRQLQEQKAHEAKRYKEQRLYLLILILVFLMAGTIIMVLFIKLKQKNKQIDKAYNKSTLANLKLKKSETILKELVATKDKFFSIIAHDLRGPIAGLMNLTGVLSTNYDELTDTELKEANESIHDSAKNLYTLLDNLLHWSRIQTGRIHFKPSKIDIHEIVQQNIDLLVIAAHEKKIQVDNNVQPNTFVNGDMEMVDTIFRNLINNGIKFTNPNGKICIEADNKDDRYWLCRVQDNGVGMNEDVQGSLFRVDKQISMSGTSSESGTGLGLILCKEFIQKNKGEIWVNSKINKGTTFYFTLPKFF